MSPYPFPTTITITPRAPPKKNNSRICVSSLRRGHANLLYIVPILVYVPPKLARSNIIIIIIIIIIIMIATYKLLWDFNIQTDYLIPARRPDLIIINKKKRTCKIVDFAVPADHRIKLKESEKKDKYLDFARELKKLWNMQVTIIPIVIDAFGTVTKGLLKGLEDLEVGGRVETIQTTALLRTEESWRLEETCCHSDFSEKPSALADVKSSNE